jgi:hypothetical protein
MVAAMRVKYASYTAVFAVLAAMAACAYNPYYEPRARWRDEVESACLARGYVRPSAYVRPMDSLSGRGSCGLDHPFKVSATNGGYVGVMPPAVIGCPMTAAVDRWVDSSVQPSARRYLGMHVVAIRQMSSYSCRTRASSRRDKLSEHAFGNALDVAGFRLADGRDILVGRSWWRGAPEERAFLRAAFAGACREFYTVLGPGYNRAHANHFHLDLLLTNAKDGRHHCRPEPAPYREGVPVAGLRDENVAALPRGPIPFAVKEYSEEEGF